MQATTSRQPRDVSLKAPDGLALHARWWPAGQPRAILVVAHGLGEHGGAYAHVVEAIASTLELDVLAPDLRGHGRSAGRRGYVRRYEDLVGDLKAAIAWAKARRPGVPIFVLGHSNGGQVVLRYALEPDAAVAGVIASNPSIRVAMPIPPGKLRLGRFLFSFAPWITLPGNVRSEWMTRDPAMQERYRDALRHNRVSAPLFFGMVEGGEMLLSRAGEIGIPMLLLIGGQDPVLSPAATREFYERLGSHDKTFMLYPKMLHEPFCELGREQVFNDLARWIAARLEPAVAV